MVAQKFDIVGLGNPVVDVLAHVEEAFLTSHALTKGAMQLSSEEVMHNIAGELKNSRRCSGGSAANTIVAMAELGLSAGFIGRVADDELGAVFTGDIREAGVTFQPRVIEGGKATACCAVCVTPDGERTMNVYIGASSEFSTADVNAEMIEQANMIYIEGYLWDADAAKDAITHAISIASQHDVRVAFTLSDLFCVDRHREDFQTLIRNHVDVLFCNEDEALALYQSSDIEDVTSRLQKEVDTFVITRSEKPAIISHDRALIDVAPAPVAHVEDATGAGDMFAAGFMYGLLKGNDAQASAEAGHRLAGHIIQQLGARSDKELQQVMSNAA